MFIKVRYHFTHTKKKKKLYLTYYKLSPLIYVIFKTYDLKINLEKIVINHNDVRFQLNHIIPL